MMIFDFNDFIHEAIHSFMKCPDNVRYGQFLVNFLHQKYPDIELPLEIDPYYENSKIPDFLNYIHSLSNDNGDSQQFHMDVR